MEPAGTQEEQRAKEDWEPTALVPRVQVSAQQVLGLLWHGKQPFTRPPSVQGVRGGQEGLLRRPPREEAQGAADF